MGNKMEDLLTNAFNTGDLKVIVVAAILYLIIYFQRRDTKVKRDDAHDNLDKRLSILENKVDKIDELDLAGKLAQIQTDLNWLKDKLK